VTTRTYANQAATLSYDPLDQMVEWQVPSGNQQWDAYDAGGNRSLQRTTSGGITQLTVYAFGIDEYHYDGSGNLQSSTHYYTLGGQLLAELSGPPNAETTNFFLTDALGGVLATFSNTVLQFSGIIAIRERTEGSRASSFHPAVSNFFTARSRANQILGRRGRRVWGRCAFRRYR
jgi:YD repeat-containing protein